jgi:23S rRNA pseudouridine2604 synthase
MKKGHQKTTMEEKPIFPMRINKYLAFKNYATRRGADEMIEKGQVFINNRPAKLGDKILETDQVEVNFRGKPKPLIYLAYYKPRGLSTEEIKVKDVFPIGRLDKDSEGLIILTNDGRVTDRLLSPKYNHEKEYLVTTKQKLRSSFKSKMEAGVKIENEMTEKCKVEILGEDKFKIILTEGKKHQIRRMCVALFQEVATLKRIRVMNVKLEKLSPGSSRIVEGEELNTFLKKLGLVE